jgi:haloalkane dehalogenase
MSILRTPDAAFASLPDYPFSPHYAEVCGFRMHYVDEGPRDAPVILMLHGEPSWSFLYRKIIAIVSAAGFRAVAPDLIGFGRSDKPTERATFSYASHVAWMTELVQVLDLKDVTLLCQDWGGLIGLRVAAENPVRFARILAANTFLPTGDHAPSDAFFAWQKFSQEVPVFPAGKIVGSGCAKPLSADVLAAYDAPFPDESYKAGARQFPLLVPTTPEDPAAPSNRKAWDALRAWKKPFLTVFGGQDMITRGAEKVLQREIPGAKGQPHVMLEGAGHFLQEDDGEELARLLLEFVNAT